MKRGRVESNEPKITQAIYSILASMSIHITNTSQILRKMCATNYWTSYTPTLSRYSKSRCTIRKYPSTNSLKNQTSGRLLTRLGIKTANVDKFPKPLDNYHMMKIANLRNTVDLKKIASDNSTQINRKFIWPSLI